LHAPLKEEEERRSEGGRQKELYERQPKKLKMKGAKNSGRERIKWKERER